MSEVESSKYLVRDPQGNVYGPADAATLREWVGQGRIVAGMHIAPRETREWMEVSQHPVLADLFGGPGPSRPVEVTAEVITDQPLSPTIPVTAQPVRPVNTLTTPAPIGTMQYETPIAARNPLSRISMISGIISPCLTITGCVPLCGCFMMPIGFLAGLGAIVTGIIAILQSRGTPGEAVAKRESMIGIILGAAALFLMLVVTVIGVLMNFRVRP